MVRRWSGVRRVGHAGTLDPAAAGVLLVCLGQGTRVVQFLSEMRKSYWARVELGTATDTYDAQGEVTQRGDPSSVGREQVISQLNSFLGSIEQAPPVFSAIKRGGVPLYRLARSKVAVSVEKRRVHIYRLELLEWKPPWFTLEVECGKGTYIRSLAHDIGQALGCGAHLKELVRWRSGPFHIQDCVTLPELEAAFSRGCWRELLYPLDVALMDRLAAIVSVDREKAIISGKSQDFGAACTGGCEREEWCRLYSVKGDIIALGHWEPSTNLWHPKKVFVGALPSAP